MTGFPRFVVTLTDPNGTDYDLSERLDLDSGVKLTEETEIDLLQFTHGECTFTLLDEDGWVSALLRGARRADVWTITIERDRVSGGWERVFQGVLFFPVEIHEGDRDVDVTAYTWSKALENASAETVQRDTSGRTGSVTSGTKVVTLSDTSLLQAGDMISLGVGNSEEHEVATVDSSTQVTTVDNWTATYSAGSMFSLRTPYYRGKTAATLADLLFAAAGIDDTQVDIAQELSTIPFPSPMNTGGLPVGGVPVAMLEHSTAISVYETTNRYDAADAAAGFGAATADTAKQDWQPYLASEPGTLQTLTTGTVVDYTDAAHPRYSWTTHTAGSILSLVLQKNGVDFATLATWDQTGGATAYVIQVTLDCANPWGEVWVGWYAEQRIPATGYWQFSGGLSRVTTAGAAVTRVSNDWYQPRFCVATGRMACNRITDFIHLASIGYALTDWRGKLTAPNVVLYDHGTVVGQLQSATDLVMDTFRAWGSYYSCVRGTAQTYLTIWDHTTGVTIGDYQISSHVPGSAVAAVFTKGGAQTAELEVYAGGVWVSVSTRESGVIPYADFSGLSVAGALKELATFTASHMWVDEYKIGHLIARKSSLLTDAEPIEIGDPLDNPTVRPVWEWLRTSVEVSGKDEDGADVSGISGSSGDSAERISVSTQLPITTAIASAVANAYRAWLAEEREQRDEQIEEPAVGRVKMLKSVQRDGKRYQALRVESDLADRVQTVQIVEIL